VVVEVSEERLKREEKRSEATETRTRKRGLRPYMPLKV
jgi:hypothetical protein